MPYSLIPDSPHFFFNPTATTEIYTLSLHDALPISFVVRRIGRDPGLSLRREAPADGHAEGRSEEHTSELQSRGHLVCRLLLEKKKQNSLPTAINVALS